MNNNTYIFVLFIIGLVVLPIHSMFVIHQCKKPLYTQGKNLQRYKYSKPSDAGNKYNSIVKRLEKVELKRCMQAYRTGDDCENFLCCKDVFSPDISGKIVELQKQRFLQDLDDHEGRIGFVLRIQKRYNQLKKLQIILIKSVIDCSDETTRNRCNCAQGEIFHQLDCLYKQLRVIYEDSPELRDPKDITKKITFGINEKGKVFVKKTKTLSSRVNDKE